MANEQIISKALAASTSFQRDLKDFLSLDSGTLALLARTGEGEEGFAPAIQAGPFSEAAKMPIEKARRVLRMAGFLYDRITEKRISVRDAVAEVSAIGASIGVNVAPQISTALEAVLTYKPMYERGAYGRNKAVSVGPHFEDIEGSWNIKVIATRQGERAKVPVLDLSVSWHDGQGIDHEAFFHVSDKQWIAFKATIDKINEEREKLQVHLSDV